MDRISRKLINQIPVPYKRKLQAVSTFISGHLSKSLMPPYPSAIIIDPVNTCNLRCPLCPTGLKKLSYKPTVMSSNAFQIIIERIPSLKHICLFNWGEPFLNPSLFEMISYANQANIRVTVHSNFSFKKDRNFFLNILKSQLDTLVISLDGTSQESYSRYRIGGDFDLVLSNIKTLARAKYEQNCKHPTIIWKFIVNRFNEKEIANAKKMAQTLGVQFETAFLGLSDDLPDLDLKNTIEERKAYWLPMNKRYQHPYYRNQYKIPLINSCCTELFQTMVVNPDGKVFPCCWVTDTKYAFGDLTKESLEDIWYNSKYLYSRSLFSKEEYSGPRERTVCSFCNTFRRVKDS